MTKTVSIMYCKDCQKPMKYHKTNKCGICYMNWKAVRRQILKNRSEKRRCKYE